MLKPDIFLLIFLLFSLIQTTKADTKFIEIAGNVIDQGNYGIVYEPAEDCLSICYYNSSCFMSDIVSSSGKSEKSCSLYYFSAYPKSLTVEITKKEEGRLVYMKTTFTSDECPSSSKNISLTIPSGYGDTYTWTTTSTGWSFQACRDGWTRFERSNGISVCMKGLKSNGLTRPAAIKMCNETGSVLVGVDSVEESQWMSNQTNLLSTSPDFWIDGERSCTKAEPQCNNFIYTDGFTTGASALIESNAFLSFSDWKNRAENCLLVFYESKETHTMNDVDCSTSNVKSAFCGYRLY